MSIFASESDLLDALAKHDELVRRCVTGELELREFARAYDDFWWRYALDGHESDSMERGMLERHRLRLTLHQRISEEVLAALCEEGKAATEEYRRAGRIGSVEALARLRQLASASATGRS